MRSSVRPPHPDSVLPKVGALVTNPAMLMCIGSGPHCGCVLADHSRVCHRGESVSTFAVVVEILRPSLTYQCTEPARSPCDRIYDRRERTSEVSTDTVPLVLPLSHQWLNDSCRWLTAGANSLNSWGELCSHTAYPVTSGGEPGKPTAVGLVFPLLADVLDSWSALS